MIGCVATNLHESSRSEYLALAALAKFGTAVPVPRQEDVGLDLHCALNETIGHRSWAKQRFGVQVKSTDDPWLFEGAMSLRCLAVDYLLGNSANIWIQGTLMELTRVLCGEDECRLYAGVERLSQAVDKLVPLACPPPSLGYKSYDTTRTSVSETSRD
jgi:hypothetical protein